MTGRGVTRSNCELDDETITGSLDVVGAYRGVDNRRYKHLRHTCRRLISIWSIYRRTQKSARKRRRCYRGLISAYIYMYRDITIMYSRSTIITFSMDEPVPAFLNVFWDRSRSRIRRNTNDRSLDTTSLPRRTASQSSTSTSTVPSCGWNAFVSRYSWRTRLMFTVKFVRAFLASTPCDRIVARSNPLTLNSRRPANATSTLWFTVRLHRPSPFSSSTTNDLFRFLTGSQFTSYKTERNKRLLKTTRLTSNCQTV